MVPGLLPGKILQLINVLPELDAQLLQAAYFAGSTHEQEFFPGERWYRVGRQLVVDINHAYDCAGKRRPIIQGFIGEVFNPAFINQHSHAIPTAAIDRYFQYYPEDLTDEVSERYYNGTPDYFTLDRMASKIIDPFGSGKEIWMLDISKVEMRMWFLYQAMTLIDFGYNSIHMGLYTLYANHTWDPGYEHLYKLTNVFRQYAAEAGTFVLLSGECPMGGIDNGLSPKLAGTDHLIFDFDTRALRPREIATNPDGSAVSGDGGVFVNGQFQHACDDEIPAEIISAFNQSPCAGIPYPAIVDPCTTRSFGGVSGGIAPALDGSGNTVRKYTTLKYCIAAMKPPVVALPFTLFK